MGTFVNFSNHSSAGWSDKQTEAANLYGKVVDVDFPKLSSFMDEADIAKIGEECIERIMSLAPAAVMCQGEFTLTFYVVKRLMEKGITCVSACTERSSTEVKLEDGSVRKESLFSFTGFRRYI